MKFTIKKVVFEEKPLEVSLDIDNHQRPCLMVNGHQIIALDHDGTIHRYNYFFNMKIIKELEKFGIKFNSGGEVKIHEYEHKYERIV